MDKLRKEKEELIVKLHIYQDKSIIDEEIIDTLKEKNKFLKQQMTQLQLEISTNIVFLTFSCSISLCFTIFFAAFLCFRTVSYSSSVFFVDC